MDSDNGVNNPHPQVFRTEAVESHISNRSAGRPLRSAPTWLKFAFWTYSVVVIVVFASALLIHTTHQTDARICIAEGCTAVLDRLRDGRAPDFVLGFEHSLPYLRPGQNVEIRLTSGIDFVTINGVTSRATVSPKSTNTPQPSNLIAGNFRSRPSAPIELQAGWAEARVKVRSASLFSELLPSILPAIGKR